MTTTKCVDCGCAILGERARCPACHDRHASELDFYAHPAVDEDAITARRKRHESATRILLRWFIVLQLVAAFILALAVVAKRGCP